MKKVVLYGEAGRRFGKYWYLDVKTPGEAMRAIMSNRPDAKAYFAQCEREKIRFKVAAGERDLNMRDMLMPFSDKETLRVAPLISGAGNATKGVIEIVVGIIIIAFTFWTGAGDVVGEELIASGLLEMVGAALVMNGIATLLAPTPGTQKGPDAVDPAFSFGFNGAQNVAVQGGCVPVLYGGPVEVGSVVLSAAIAAVDTRHAINQIFVTGPFIDQVKGLVYIYKNVTFYVDDNV